MTKADAHGIVAALLPQRKLCKQQPRRVMPSWENWSLANFSLFGIKISHTHAHIHLLELPTRVCCSGGQDVSQNQSQSQKLLDQHLFFQEDVSCYEPEEIFRSWSARNCPYPGSRRHLDETKHFESDPQLYSLPLLSLMLSCELNQIVYFM